MPEMIKCEGLVKIYKTEDIEVMALQGLDLTIEQGELIAIIGNSGSGKSTFLNMVGGLERPSAGRLFVDGEDLFQYTDEQLKDYKQNTVGFVWQNNARNLFPYLTAEQNIMVPMQFAKNKNVNKKDRAKELLEMVGLSHKRDRLLHQLSGGEQQRIAIAIALANQPKILLADEPTGAVDMKTSNMIQDMFREFNRELGVTIVIVTHDLSLSNKVNRVVSIRDGKISSERLIKADYLSKIKELDNFSAADTHEEYAILDKNGRVQIPHDYLEAAGITDHRVKIKMDGTNIIITK